jgi:WS/DGAT/MGAT family acyltransferase
MAPTDALFWYAESALPIFRPIIAGLYVLRATPDRVALDRALLDAVRAVPRLRQRVMEAPLHLTTPEWIEDPHFDFDYHVRHLSVAAPGTMVEVLELAAFSLATPLDRERPLWEVYCIDGVEGGRSAIFMKLHHALVDGVGSMAILDALTRPPGLNGFPYALRPPRVTASARAARALRNSAYDAMRMVSAAAALPMSFARDPAKTAEQAFAVVRGLMGVVADTRKPPIVDPLTKKSRGLSRRLDVASVSIARLRAIKEPWGVSINDIVLTALTGSLRAYYREQGVRMTALNCMVPMNLRSGSERNDLGNRVGICNVVLPLDESTIEGRLEAIVAQTRAAKRDKRGALYPFLLEALTFMPGPVFGWLARHSLGRINIACTNVPGVADTRRMAGVDVEAINPFASVVEGTPIVLALLSYAGRMDIGLDTDPEAIHKPHRLIELFDAALDELERNAAAGPQELDPERGVPKSGGVTS